MKRSSLHLLCLLTGLIFPFTPAWGADVLDSLRVTLAESSGDTAQLRLFHQLGEGYMDRDQDSAHYYWDRGLQVTNDLLAQSTSLPKKDLLAHKAEFINDLGLIWKRKGEVDKAYDHYLESIAINKDIGNEPGLAQSYINLGTLFIQFGNTETGLEHLKQSLEISERLGLTQYKGSIYNNMAFVYERHREFEMALEYYFKALDIHSQLHNQNGMAAVCNNIAIRYYYSKDYDKAFEYYSKSLDLKRKLQDKKGEAATLDNIAYFYLKQKDYEQARLYLQDALALNQQLGYQKGISRSLRGMSEYYRKTGQLDSAILYGQEALTIAEQLKYPRTILDAAGSLKKVYEQKNLYQEAYVVSELYYEMKDSLQNTKMEKQVMEMRMEHKFEQEIQRKQDQIALQALETQNKALQRNGALVALALTLILSVVLIFFYRKRQQSREREMRLQIEAQLKELRLLNTKLLSEPQAPSPKPMQKSDLNNCLETPLSDRELEVLYYIAKGYNNREIAEALFVSVNTIKTHIKRIYEKLDVSNRTAAVLKAANFELIVE